jgi:hypothetical protein
MALTDRGCFADSGSGAQAATNNPDAATAPMTTKGNDVPVLFVFIHILGI